MRRTRGQVTITVTMLAVAVLAVTGFSAGVVYAAPAAPEPTISGDAAASFCPVRIPEREAVATGVLLAGC
ncbi:hypothetical protein KIH74_10770 [Kineosporia sp. J2-2]|uniref:Secreted protein n=1 Tax=Kineosporia corallincola TaxID=2835133 RepID=A0ABS5TIK1_9ACTN|nr:hypothetical protein [Kineosporia corallincola]MBT0769404.1 hypothetical protein [Kineosporia corallincola]